MIILCAFIYYGVTCIEQIVQQIIYQMWSIQLWWWSTIGFDNFLCKIKDQATRVNSKDIYDKNTHYITLSRAHTHTNRYDVHFTRPVRKSVCVFVLNTQNYVSWWKWENQRSFHLNYIYKLNVNEGLWTKPSSSRGMSGMLWTAIN